MPRTKVSKNANSKRIRSSTCEERLFNKLRDLDEMEEHFFEQQETRELEHLNEISEMVKTLRASTPQWLLKMKWGDIKNNHGNEQQLSNNTGPNMSTNREFVSSMVRLNVNTTRQNVSLISSNADEGYKSDCTTKTALDSDSEVLATALAVPKIPGPLESAKRRRRSKSVEPNQRKVSSRSQASHYSVLQHLTHISRSKMRTPLMMNRHPKSNSSDRAYNVITPKVQPNTPLMIMRHARVGEQIFSLSGSPVVTSRFAENTANVNIPMEDDILSIRPIEMANVDPSMLERLKPETFEHLKRLKQNLDVIMRVAEEKWGHE